MPLNSLRSFEAAARLGSFSAAAKELSVTPSAVSLQVRRLEQMLGRPLFIRGHRSVALSPAGEALAPELSQLFSRMEQLLAASFGAESRLLRVSALPSFANQWLAPRLGHFMERWPQYEVLLLGEDRLVSFDHNEADVGIRYGPGDYAGVHQELISKASAFPVCSPDFARRNSDKLVNVAGLADLPLIEDEIGRRAPGLPTWPAWFEAAGFRELPTVSGPRFQSQHTALMSAANGQGVALGLSPLVDMELASGRLVRLFDIAIPSSFSFWLVCSPERARERKLSAFRKWIAHEVGGPEGW